MKKILVILLAVSFTAGHNGCKGNGDSLERGAASSASTQAGQAANSVQAELENSMANVDASASSDYIGEDTAKAAALEKAGLTEEQVTLTETSFEYDDGMAVYQIDFFADGAEYEVEVSAVDGSIAGYELESQYD